MDTKDVIQDMMRVRKGLKVTKIVATRSLRGRFGDTFLGYSVNVESIQQDGTAGLEELADNPLGGLNLVESQKVSLVLGMQVDRGAYLNAVAGGNVDPEVADKAIRALTANYVRKYQELMEKEDKR